MPIFMDVHIVPGVKARNVAEAHRLDLLHQEEYGCNCMTYWIDEERESIFCLIEAPDRDAVEQMHSRAHGLIPNKIIEVKQDVVQAFLGRIYDPEDAVKTEDGLKIFCSPSFRILLVAQLIDPVLMRHCIGLEKANNLISEHQAAVRKNIESFGGTEAEHDGNGFIISFDTAARAMACADSILKHTDPADAEALDLKIAIHGGEPLEKSEKLFGDTIRLATHLCMAAKPLRIAVSSVIRNLIAKDAQSGKNLLSLPLQDETLLDELFVTLDTHWQDATFDVEDFAKAMAMSKSQLYRKTISLLGNPPNILLKAYRMNKARERMNKQFYTISQVTFDAGFSSPSYFTKCFKQQFGLLPMEYVELLRTSSPSAAPN